MKRLKRIKLSKRTDVQVILYAGISIGFVYERNTLDKRFIILLPFIASEIEIEKKKALNEL